MVPGSEHTGGYLPDSMRAESSAGSKEAGADAGQCARAPKTSSN